MGKNFKKIKELSKTDIKGALNFVFIPINRNAFIKHETKNGEF